MSFTYVQSFQSRRDLDQYESNAHLIYAISLREQIEDIHNLVATSLTDGNDDKKADIVYIDEDKGVAIIAQGYYSNRERQSAPSNKASDLNTAATWLLAREIDDVPAQIKPKAIELRESCSNGTIKRIEFWYVHNLNQSENVLQEMRSVEHSAKGLINTYFPEKTIEIVGLEVGNETIEEWYLDSESRISVVDEYFLDTRNGFEINTENWNAFVTFVPGSWIKELYARHGRMLFSANIRDYLGHRRSDKNINHRIQQTAAFESSNFWVYNNGMTALVNSFELLPTDGKLKIQGISIVNGAQTTGALGKIDAPLNADLLVPIRFIMCDSNETVKKIIQYNNSQNKIEATDFRSNDATQRRLRHEFEMLEGVYYDGGRRQENNTTQYGIDYLPSYTVAQALSAFYGDPISAANKKSDIWVIDDLYGKIFNDSTNSKNIIFVYSLFKTIESVKIDLSEKSTLTEQETKHLDFLRYRKSFYLLCNAISSVMEQIMGSPIPNKRVLGFHGNIKPSEAIELWKPVVNTALIFSRPLQIVMETGFNSQENINRGIEEFTAQMSAFLDVTRLGVNSFTESVRENTTV